MKLQQMIVTLSLLSSSFLCMAMDPFKSFPTTKDKVTLTQDEFNRIWFCHDGIKNTTKTSKVLAIVENRTQPVQYIINTPTTPTVLTTIKTKKQPTQKVWQIKAQPVQSNKPAQNASPKQNTKRPDKQLFTPSRSTHKAYNQPAKKAEPRKDPRTKKYRPATNQEIIEID